MQLRTRRIFFWSLIPTFVVAGTCTVLYSQGYRIDLKTHAATKVGAFYVRGYPRSAHITLDGESLDTGSWWPLQSGTLANSLVPGTYQLHADAPGYKDWDASIVVKPSLVTERKSLILFPTATTTVLPTSSTPTRLDIDGDSGELIIGDDEGKAAYAGATRISGTYVGNIGGRIVTTVPSTGKTSAKTLRFQTPGETTATTASYRGTIIGTTGDSVLVRESEKLITAYSPNTGAKTIFASSTNSIGLTLRTDRYDAWSEQGATNTTLIIKRRSDGARAVLALPRLVQIDSVGSQIGALDTRGSLWLIDPASNTKKEIAHSTTFASWRSDGKAVAIVADGVLEVVPLTQDVVHGKITTALKTHESAERITWYPDGEHLFVQTASELLFVDIIGGSSNEQHIYRLAKPDAWTFSAATKTLYTEKQGGVEAYVFPD